MHRNKNIILTAAVLLLMTLNISPSYSSSPDSQAWKDSWHVNTVWYQIFPDRFCNADLENEPETTEQYKKNGELKKAEITSWTDDKPNIYSKYGGDLKGIDEKLPYLSELGISGIWMNPIFKATSNHKYNTADYAMIDPAFGDRPTLAKLVSDAHEKGIKVILDGVFNHTGYEFWAFADIVQKGENSTYKDWYYIKGYPVVKLWEQTKNSPANYECWWGVGSLPKLNVDNPDARAYICDTCKGWMKTGIDGWRLDVPEDIKSETFWKEWSQAVKSVNPNAYLTGEIWGKADKWIGQDGVFDGIMNYYGFREPVLGYFCAEKLTVSEFDKMLAERRSIYPHSINCRLQNLLSSHDTARILSAIKNKDEKDSDKEKKNYDKGPASAADIAKYKALLIFQMTYVGAPMIYYGDEIGMTGGKDPDCRRPMIWESDRQNRDLLEWHKKLIQIRNENKSLRTGEFETVLCKDREKIYAYRRIEGSERITVILNYSPKAAKVKIPAEKDIEFIDLISDNRIKAGKNGIKIEVSPYSGAILKELAGDN